MREREKVVERGTGAQHKRERERERKEKKKKKPLSPCYSRVSKITLYSVYCSKDVKNFKNSMLDVDDILRG